MVWGAEIVGAGRRRTISMSNTRKITARRKNRRENGIRAEFLGSKPHSNGDSFSRSWSVRLASIQAKVGTIIARAMGVREEIRVRCIKGSQGAYLGHLLE